jgi:hypothetical protein
VQLGDLLTPEVAALLRERMNALAATVQARFRDAVIPIYGATENGRPVHIGSAVLLTINGRRVILTAAHVVDNNAVTTLYGPGRSETTGEPALVPIESSFHVTAAPGGDRLRDQLDFAFCGVSDEAARAMAGRFIGQHEIAASTATDAGRLYTALGYPNSKNNKHDPRTLSVRPMLLPYSNLHRVDAKIAVALPGGGAGHLFLPYGERSRDENGAADNSVGPRGMSGGAVVDAGRPASLKALRGQEEDPEPLLAGVIIALKERRVLLATRMAAIMPALTEAFPLVPEAQPATGSPT